ncbi:MAG: hypothetical protein GY699_10415 [Desulfobacteraceae bacterium]|nr:hypothetical protein [Desulfobacteraceae bacterium]
MISLILLLLGIAGAVAGTVIIIRLRAALRKRSQKKQKAHRRSIKPSISFYLKKPESMIPNKHEICTKNIGRGAAVDVAIDDFYCPEEKDWHFKFQGISLLDLGEEKVVDFDFYVSTYKAANKTDQLWMFDPDHDHDFAAKIVLSYYDIEKNAYSQTITIGENKRNKSKRLQRLKLIQKAMSSKHS